MLKRTSAIMIAVLFSLSFFTTILFSCTVAAADVVSFSHDDRYLLLSDQLNQRFLVIDLEKALCFEFKGTLTGGRRACWSPDDRFIAFKIVQETVGGTRTHVPCVFDREHSSFMPLIRNASLAGSPVWNDSGDVYVTNFSQLCAFHKTDFILEKYDLSLFCDWIDISPDGNLALYIAADEQLWMLDMKTNTRKKVSDIPEALCCPRWSPDGSKALVQSVSASLYVFDNKSDKITYLGLAQAPEWMPGGNRIIACEPVFHGDRIAYHRIVIYSLRGKAQILLDNPFFDPNAVVISSDESTIYFSCEKESSVYRCSFRNAMTVSPEKIEMSRMPMQHFAIPNMLNRYSISFRQERDFTYIKGVPYLHQVYCTPNHFDGRWACNGSAAIMAIGYYGILSDWDFSAPSPFTHTSHLGNYVSEIYTFNGHTFDTGSPDASGNMAYGAYGYIVQNDWEDTREHMREYIVLHGLASPYVHWSPYYSDAENEIAQSRPFVILTSITTSGHYLTVVGCYSTQHTLYLNDPYGNKNEGYRNFNGAGVCYDWPGYNNGYENLNTVWCYIYARDTPPAEPAGSIDNPIEIVEFPFTDINTTRSSGGSDVFDYYNCAPGVDERGREIIYHFTSATSGTLSVSVDCDGDVDIDVHLLNELDSNACIKRAHIGFTQWIPAGEYWIACDTYKNGSGVELMGDYQLDCSFQPDSTPSPTQTPPPVPSSTHSTLLILIMALSLLIGTYSFSKHP